MSFQPIPLPLPDPGPTGAGAERPVDNYTSGAVALTIAGGAAQVEGSMDGTNWGIIGASVTTVGTTIVPVPHAVRFLRVNVTTDITSGGAVFGGHLQAGS